MDTGYVHFNRQLFSAFGYSYLAPVLRTVEGKQKSCPVLFDVHGGRCAQCDVQAFMQRIARATYFGKTRIPALGVIAAKGFTNDAWALARKNRVVTIDLRQAFGDEALDVMILVEDLVGQLKCDPASYSHHEDLGQIVTLIKDLKANPVVVAIRSIAFEAFACCAIQSVGYQRAGMGKDVPFGEDTTRDVDVYGWLGDDVRMIECKAHHADLELKRTDVTKFFCETVPAYVTWLSKRNERPNRCIAEIWTTGKIGDEARDALAGVKLSPIIEPKLLDREAISNDLFSALKERGRMLIDNIAEYQPKNEGD